MITKRPSKWSAVGGVLKNPVEYELTLNVPVAELSLYEIASVETAENLAVLIATVKQRTRAGKALIDVSPYLKSLVSNVKAVDEVDHTSADNESSAVYFITYKDADGLPVSDFQQKRYCLSSALQKVDADMSEYVVASSAPVWKFDLTTVKCLQEAPRSSSVTLAKLKDTNANSPTFDSYKTPGEYEQDFFTYSEDATLCPLGVVDTSPNWQPVLSTIKCEQDDPATRTNSRRVAKVQDINPDSIYYNQYGQGVEATVGTSNINDATYYFYDTSATECPIAEPVGPGEIAIASAEYNYAVSPTRLRLRIERLGGDVNSGVSGEFIIENLSNVQQGGTESFFLTPGQMSKIREFSFGLPSSGNFRVKVSHVDTFGYVPYAVPLPITYVTEFTF